MDTLLDENFNPVTEFKLNTRYKGHMPMVGPMTVWNELQADGDDIVMVRQPEGNSGTLIPGYVARLEDFELEKGRTHAQEEAALIKFILAHRQRHGENTILESGLTENTTYLKRVSEELVVYSANNQLGFAYLTFLYHGIWVLRLNGSNWNLAVAKWNDLHGLRLLCKAIQSPLKELEAKFALAEPGKASHRVKRIERFKVFTELELKEYEALSQELQDTTFLATKDEVEAYLNIENIYAGIRDLGAPNKVAMMSTLIEVDDNMVDEYLKRITEIVGKYGYEFLLVNKKATKAVEGNQDVVEVLGVAVLSRQRFLDNLSSFLYDPNYASSLIKIGLGLTGPKYTVDENQFRALIYANN